MKVRRLFAMPAGVALAWILATSTALAQYTPLGRPQSNAATGEKYNVEIAYGVWNPTPEIVFSSEQFGILGSDINLSEDLDVLKAKFQAFRLVLRPGRKHKFRGEYIPIRYDVDTVLRRNLIFNGVLYPVGLPIQGEFKWNAWRAGYEYDFIYRDRGFLGFLIEAKYTDVRAELTTPITSEYAEAKAPIPAIGLVGRGYILPNLAIGGEFSAFRLPENEDRDYSGRYYDFDAYATFNFTNNLGVTGGYRRLTLGYQVDNDFGDFIMNGYYLMGVARF
ncbi:hypothetical protein TBR22_A19250 [Luteitalea sp. TBR-22]|uniref:hypothetical protein n=1 Tax=Luteitalea sp. TBR-22 TaxID=2802971 RepID=UPI001AF548B2|nr:hypothetical protein [Luteitalea sp. TBR-22]BCS32703.1 hypothetical protein TBR22_A19250 [Luteitalea sp. TBR-22]